MDLLGYTFNVNEILKLKEYRNKQSNARLKVRFIALLMLATGYKPENITDLLGMTLQTIVNWLQLYIDEGIERLNYFTYKPKECRLDENQISQLKIWVKEKNPGKIKQVARYIQDNFNIKYDNESVRILLKKNGLKVIRPKVIPGNPPSEEKQKNFVIDYFERKKTSETGMIFLFGDGMHLVHQNIPSLCWGDPKHPPIIKTNTGRMRLNILGAYNPDDHSFLHLTGEENCNAERVIEYLDMIVNAYETAPGIVLYLDNATYFKAKIVSDWLEKHPKLHLEFLPPYAPNLNLIERFWRFVKEKLVKNTYYEKYITFRAKVFQFLNHVTRYEDEFKSLMVENFQIIKCTA